MRFAEYRAALHPGPTEPMGISLLLAADGRPGCTVTGAAGRVAVVVLVVVVAVVVVVVDGASVEVGASVDDVPAAVVLSAALDEVEASLDGAAAVEEDASVVDPTKSSSPHAATSRHRTI